jgi:hypothetical protein
VDSGQNRWSHSLFSTKQPLCGEGAPEVFCVWGGNGREGTSFSWRRVLDHLGLTPYLHSITLLIMMGLMAGIWYYQIGVIKYNFLDYERYSNSLSSGC